MGIRRGEHYIFASRFINSSMVMPISFLTTKNGTDLLLVDMLDIAGISRGGQRHVLDFLGQRGSRSSCRTR
jgi:hypothetical protein